MRCPNCGSDNDHVIESRKRTDYIYRKRQCTDCGCRYLTHEIFMRPCSEWMQNGKTKVLKLSQLVRWQEAVWIEIKAYGKSSLYATSVRDISDDEIRFDNGQAQSVKLYGKAWRAWTKRPAMEDLKTDWE